MTRSTTHSRPRLARGLVALIALVSSAACGGGGGGGGNGNGQTVQLGPDLTFAPNNGVRCQDGYPIQINASFPQPFHLQGAPSCLLLTFFSGAQPTASGTAVSANIRVGPVTGPMRFVRMRILFQHGFGRACCSVEQYGATFTPQANAVTTVPLNFPMTEERVPPPNDPTVVANDLVALEILSPNVPLPGVWTRNGGAELTLPNYMWFPALSAQGVGAPSSNLRSDGSMSGFLPSYNLNFVPAGAAALRGPSITAP
jgi:hypothetical protein